MSIDAYHDTLEKARKLSLKEQYKLIEEILAGLRQAVEDPQTHDNLEEAGSTSQEEKEPPLHSIMEFEGLGKEVWEGINVDDYLNEERNSWDG
jgi:hypothetical protein